MSLVQGISRFPYVYEGLTAFAVHRVDCTLVDLQVTSFCTLQVLPVLSMNFSFRPPSCTDRLRTSVPHKVRFCLESGKTFGCVFYVPICLPVSSECC
ncbi:hypothetical protein DPMN_124283 [Dreissena polymorpha]|uniref:Uncharacterized protein n=1 Tax=Dreissena polymorpha TaxID=45954 RepID=A0A9D4GT66_DREPO|nr:hypothetical protein DPMN_124283 [Dreissena polymorpha]